MSLIMGRGTYGFFLGGGVLNDMVYHSGNWSIFLGNFTNQVAFDGKFLYKLGIRKNHKFRHTVHRVCFLGKLMPEFFRGNESPNSRISQTFIFLGWLLGAFVNGS